MIGNAQHALNDTKQSWNNEFRSLSVNDVENEIFSISDSFYSISSMIVPQRCEIQFIYWLLVVMVFKCSCCCCCRLCFISFSFSFHMTTVVLPMILFHIICYSLCCVCVWLAFKMVGWVVTMMMTMTMQFVSKNIMEKKTQQQWNVHNIFGRFINGTRWTITMCNSASR